MAITTWENLPKEVLDPTTIAEAIDQAVQSHEEDPEAHLGTGESLQSHRASEIIDHLAESVVNDKIKRTARRYVAIVDPSSESDFDTVASAVAYATSVGGGDIFITRGTHYLSDDVILPPTIGLYGNGVGETTLKSNSGTTRNFIFYVRVYGGEGYLVVPDTRNGTNTCTYDAAGDSYPAPVPGMFLRVYTDPESVLEVTNYNQGTDTLTLASNFADIDGEAECEFYNGFVFTNGSSTVQLISNSDIAINEYYSGMSIVNPVTGNTYRTIGITETGEITLAEAFSGTSDTYPGYFQFLENNTINIQGITFSRLSTPVGISGQTGNSTAYVENCQNVVLNSSSGLGVPAMYLGCVFDADDTITYSLSLGIHYINCVWRASENGSNGITVGGEGVMLGCRFLANGYTNHHWLRGISAEARVIGCYFESVEGETVFNSVGNSTSKGIRIAFNTFNFENNKTWTLQNVRSVITGNRFVFSGSGALAFNSSSSENMITNNYVVGDITDAGTGNVLLKNMTTNAREFTTLATSATALDLRANQVAQLTPTSTRTLTSTVPPAGQMRQFIVLTSGTSSYTLTFGTGFKTTGTLATGVTSARRFVFNFVSDGTKLIEMSRTVAIA